MDTFKLMTFNFNNIDVSKKQMDNMIKDANSPDIICIYDASPTFFNFNLENYEMLLSFDSIKIYSKSDIDPPILIVHMNDATPKTIMVYILFRGVKISPIPSTY